MASEVVSRPDKPIVLKEVHGEYKDAFNNVIRGECPACNITLAGGDNQLDFAGANIRGTHIVFRSTGCRMTLGKGCHFGGNNVNINRPNVSFVLEEGVFLQSAKLHLWNTSKMRVGRNTTFGYDCDFVVSSFSELQIGKDCMFSSYVKINVADDHAIFDVRTGKNLNSNEGNKRRHVILGDHVWVCKDAFFLGNTRIGNGSIVGARSLVKGEFPNNCIVAGDPARIIAVDRSWSKVYGSDDIGTCGEEYIMPTIMSEEETRRIDAEQEHP